MLNNKVIYYLPKGGLTYKIKKAETIDPYLEEPIFKKMARFFRKRLLPSTEETQVQRVITTHENEEDEMNVLVNLIHDTPGEKVDENIKKNASTHNLNIVYVFKCSEKNSYVQAYKDLKKILQDKFPLLDQNVILALTHYDLVFGQEETIIQNVFAILTRLHEEGYNIKRIRKAIIGTSSHAHFVTSIVDSILENVMDTYDHYMDLIYRMSEAIIQSNVYNEFKNEFVTILGSALRTNPSFRNHAAMIIQSNELEKLITPELYYELSTRILQPKLEEFSRKLINGLKGLVYTETTSAGKEQKINEFLLKIQSDRDFINNLKKALFREEASDLDEDAIFKYFRNTTETRDQVLVNIFKRVLLGKIIGLAHESSYMLESLSNVVDVSLTDFNFISRLNMEMINVAIDVGNELGKDLKYKLLSDDIIMKYNTNALKGMKKAYMDIARSYRMTALLTNKGKIASQSPMYDTETVLIGRPAVGKSEIARTIISLAYDIRKLRISYRYSIEKWMLELETDGKKDKHIIEIIVPEPDRVDEV